jgi:hypothetical protein
MPNTSCHEVWHASRDWNWEAGPEVWRSSQRQNRRLGQNKAGPKWGRAKTEGWEGMHGNSLILIHFYLIVNILLGYFYINTFSKYIQLSQRSITSQAWNWSYSQLWEDTIKL